MATHTISNLVIVSYNSTGLSSQKQLEISDILDREQVDFMFLQETWLHNMYMTETLEAIHSSYHATGVSGIDNSDICYGRAYGGVAILWNTKVAHNVQVVKTVNKRLCAVRVRLPNDDTLLLINTYMPCDNWSRHNILPEYEDCFNAVENIIEQQNCTYVVLGGDINSDPIRNNAHSKHLLDVVNRNNLTLMTSKFSLLDSTYVSPSGHGCVIDHFIVSSNLQASVFSLCVLKDVDKEHSTGHKPLKMDLNLNLNLSSQRDANKSDCNIAWHRINNANITVYNNVLQQYLKHFDDHYEVLQCDDSDCKQASHLKDISDMCSEITECCIRAGNYSLPKCKKSKGIPYWNETIKPLKDDNLFWGKMWKDCGMPSHGVVHDTYKRVKRNYHYKIREFKSKDTLLRRSKMANAMSKDNSRLFWKELNKMAPTKRHSPSHIDGITNPQEICQLLKAKYEKLLNIDSFDSDWYEQFRISLSDLPTYRLSAISQKHVLDAIDRLKKDKGSGGEGINSNHIIYGHRTLSLPLCKLLNCMLKHGHYPDCLLLSTVISIPKNKSGDICSSDNLRGISLMSSINKVFEWVILMQYTDLLRTSDLQFSYKPLVSTSLCTLAAKEIIEYYISSGSPVYSCFLDASKAFDCVRYRKLFALLYERRIPSPIIKLLLDMHIRQRIQTSWMGYFSDEFGATNGVRQGGVLSPVLFTIYYDALIQKLSETNVGCHVGHKFVGALSYADDLVIMAPTIAGLQTMISVCENYSKEYGITFNASKTVCVAFGVKDTDSLSQVMIDGKHIEWNKTVKHLGNHLQCTLADDEDIRFKSNELVGRTNSICANFKISKKVLYNLFESKCCAFYDINKILFLFLFRIPTLNTAQKCL